MHDRGPRDHPTDAPCELLPWDTDFFGFEIARALTERLSSDQQTAIDAWCRARGVRCLYFPAVADDAQTAEVAERRGYHLVDVRLTLGRDLKDAPTMPPGVRSFKQADLTTLEQIARASHRNTRFFFDRRFPVDRAHALYERWIRTSCEGASDAVLVVEDAGRACGYVTCDLAPGGASGSIGLIAVAPSVQGKGYGRALVQAAVAHLAARGAKHMTVVTQGRNVVAQRLYARAGFIDERIQLYYHLWYDV